MIWVTILFIEHHCAKAAVMHGAFDTATSQDVTSFRGKFWLRVLLAACDVVAILVGIAPIIQQPNDNAVWFLYWVPVRLVL